MDSKLFSSANLTSMLVLLLVPLLGGFLDHDHLDHMGHRNHMDDHMGHMVDHMDDHTDHTT